MVGAGLCAVNAPGTVSFGGWVMRGEKHTRKSWCLARDHDFHEGKLRESPMAD